MKQLVPAEVSYICSQIVFYCVRRQIQRENVEIGKYLLPLVPEESPHTINKDLTYPVAFAKLNQK